MKVVPLYVLFVSLLVAFKLVSAGHACTTAVISGRATNDGRPILWKNRDTTSSVHNEVIFISGSGLKAIAVVNGGSKSSVWMGVNEAGFCIENSLSTDLRDGSTVSGPGNGQFMKLALQRCRTVADFQRLLDATNDSGRATVANFGVIDSSGGAAIFEAGSSSYEMFDANDPNVAPHGYLVRANFATTAHDLPSMPNLSDNASIASLKSSERFCRAGQLLDSARESRIDLRFVIRNMARDMATASGEVVPGTVNAIFEELPQEIETNHTISRTTTVSAVVFHGVKPGEDPLLTTMWTILGDPKFSIAVPCCVAIGEVADELTDPRGGEIGEISLTLRDWALNLKRDGVSTAGLKGIWTDVWKVEDQLLSDVLQARERWSNQGLDLNALNDLHRNSAKMSMDAMQLELQQAKAQVLSAKRSPLDAKPPMHVGEIKVAIFDRTNGTANGPRNLLRILTKEEGFHAQRVDSQQIRNGILSDFDVVILPGGSGSQQAEVLGDSGKQAILRFVENGGGYVGICAGAYLASAHYDWSLGLIDARVWDRTHWARGTGNVELSLCMDELTKTDTGNSVSVYYGQGPLLYPAGDDKIPDYELLATYASEINKKGAPQGAMREMHAIVRGVYGNGRVFCSSPHPEASGGPNWIIVQGVRWAAGKLQE